MSRFSVAGILLLVTAASCGGGAPRVAAPPAPARAAPNDAGLQAVAVTDAAIDGGADASRDMLALDCAGDRGPLTVEDPSGELLPLPVSTTSYPLLYPFISSEEATRRAQLLGRHHPGFTFTVNDVGAVVRITTERIPCALSAEVRQLGYLSVNTEGLVPVYLAALARELKDVPFLSEYRVEAFKSANGSAGLAFSPPPDGPPVLWDVLRKKQLDDATLFGKLGGARVQWWRIVRTETAVPQSNPCARYTGPMHCDPPGPIVTTRVARNLAGERLLTARYTTFVTRSVVTTRRANGLEVRRVADLDIDDTALAKDLFGAQYAVQLQYESEITVTGSKRRDALTGEALAAPAP